MAKKHGKQPIPSWASCLLPQPVSGYSISALGTSILSLAQSKSLGVIHGSSRRPASSPSANPVIFPLKYIHSSATSQHFHFRLSVIVIAFRQKSQASALDSPSVFCQPCSQRDLFTCKVGCVILFLKTFQSFPRQDFWYMFNSDFQNVFSGSDFTDEFFNLHTNFLTWQF